MPPSRQQANVDPGLALTTFKLERGDPASNLEDSFTLPQSSPIVSSWAFMDWKLSDGPPSVASAPRSKVSGAILSAARKPSLSDFSALDGLSFISSELTSQEATRWATELNKTDAFDNQYKTFREWGSVAPTFTAAAPNPDTLSLREDSFTEFAEWDQAAGPSELGFLATTTLGSLIRADMHLLRPRIGW